MKRTPEALTDGSWDLLSLGRGIIGAGVALDATLRGLYIALIDEGDSAAGTSSLSSKLIHRDLRYLEHGDFHLVYEALHQRGRLLHARRPPTPLHQTPNAAGPDQTHPAPSPVVRTANALAMGVDMSGGGAGAAKLSMPISTPSQRGLATSAAQPRKGCRPTYHARRSRGP